MGLDRACKPCARTILRQHLNLEALGQNRCPALGIPVPVLGPKDNESARHTSMSNTAMTIKLSALLLAAASLGLAQAPQSAASFRHDYLINFSDVETKVVSLAKAMPEEKYSWRPGAGVRSVSEVYVHIANGNRLLLSVMNGMPPRDAFMKMVKTNEERERTITEKAKVVADLEASFKEVHAALDSATEESLSKAIKFFGQDATARAAYLSIMNHVSEHLGQSIAYARMNGIVPPWSK